MILTNFVTPELHRRPNRLSVPDITYVPTTARHAHPARDSLKESSASKNVSTLSRSPASVLIAPE